MSIVASVVALSALGIGGLVVFSLGLSGLGGPILNMLATQILGCCVENILAVVMSTFCCAAVCCGRQPNKIVKHIVNMFIVAYCIYIPGKPGFCFHYCCAVYDECK